MEDENISDPANQLRHIKKLRNFSKVKLENLSSSISRFITNFGEKQEKLSKLIKSTQKQQLAIDNITTVRDSLQNTLDLLNTESRLRSKINKNVQNEFNDFIRAMEEIRNAKETLKNRNFDDGKAAINQLESLEKEGFRYARQYFQNLTRTVSKELKEENFQFVDGEFVITDPQLQADMYFPITQQIFEHMISLVHLLHTDRPNDRMRDFNDNFSPEHLYYDVRKAFLNLTLTPHIVNAKKKRKLSQQGMNVLDLAAYKRRKHPIHMLSFTTQYLLVREKKITEKVFGDDYLETLSSYVNGSLIYYAESIDKLIKPVQSHIDVLFDLDLKTTISLVIDDLECTCLADNDSDVSPVKMIRNCAKNIDNTIIDVLNKYIDAVANHDPNFNTPTGSVSPLTSNVLHYLNVLVTYSNVLNGYEVLTMEYVATQAVTKLMQNLEAKSKKYQDRVLTTLFMMNNAHYAYNEIQNSRLKDVVQLSVCQNIEDIIQKSQINYFALTWDTAFQILDNKAIGEVKPGERLSKKQCKIVKKQFKDFAQQMQVILHKHKKYCTIYVKLMAPIRNDATKKVSTIYEKFFHKWKDSGFAKNPEKYYCFQPATLADRISRLYGSEDNHAGGDSTPSSHKGVRKVSTISD